MTVYTTSEDGSSIVSKVKTGLNSFKDIKLPISDRRLPATRRWNKRHMNIKDVYDDSELKQYSPNLSFLKAVDQRTGYRSKQMLIAPILGGDSGTDLMGVIQLINNLAGQPFSSLHDEGVMELSKTLAIAFRVRQQMPGTVASKFEYLVIDNVIAAASSTSRPRPRARKNKKSKTSSWRSSKVKQPAIGAALAKFFGVEYEPFKGDRIKPPDLLKNIKRDYAEGNHWVPLEDSKNGILVMSTDPGARAQPRMVKRLPPFQGGLQGHYREGFQAHARPLLRRRHGAWATWAASPSATCWAASRTKTTSWATARAPTMSPPRPTTSS